VEHSESIKKNVEERRSLISESEKRQSSIHNESHVPKLEEKIKDDSKHESDDGLRQQKGNQVQMKVYLSTSYVSTVFVDGCLFGLGLCVCLRIFLRH
jgi:hypothetical protein